MERKISSVIIDTSAYYKAQCDFAGINNSIIPMFLRLLKANGIQLLTHPILEYEIRKHIKDSALVKILEYNDDYARLYCINYNVHSGSLCTFLKKDGKWIFKSWGRGVWSRHGSADGFMWPYGR